MLFLHFGALKTLKNGLKVSWHFSLIKKFWIYNSQVSGPAHLRSLHYTDWWETSWHQNGFLASVTPRFRWGESVVHLSYSGSVLQLYACVYFLLIKAHIRNMYSSVVCIAFVTLSSSWWSPLLLVCKTWLFHSGSGCSVWWKLTCYTLGNREAALQLDTNHSDLITNQVKKPSSLSYETDLFFMSYQLSPPNCLILPHYVFVYSFHTF